MQELLQAKQVEAHRHVLMTEQYLGGPSGHTSGHTLQSSGHISQDMPMTEVQDRTETDFLGLWCNYVGSTGCCSIIYFGVRIHDTMDPQLSGLQLSSTLIIQHGM